MASYVIADFEVLDVEGMREYARRVGATIAQYGGTYLVQGGRSEISEEGNWHPHRGVGFSYQDADLVLFHYCEEHLTVDDIVTKGFPREIVGKVLERVTRTDFKHHRPHVYTEKV